MTNKQRLSIKDVDPTAYQAVLPLQKYVNSARLDAGLVPLLDIRASQLNGCAWCLDMHTDDAREAGVDQRRIDLVAAWHEAGDLFSEREQAALALTEQMTLLSRGGVSDAVWERVRDAFDEQQIVQLIMAISVINVWNRMNVTARTSLPAKP
ncbi:carboxymuconolactone decarboxylase family protein [Pseudactinotalea sp. HY158]|uniref:carboxymuconolactone decarboxylase family protein n=1 Tax=Pseudactinotalea sp. HY158 TaxID=2654547 RepID=UPI00129CD068|nr:carboxymuconolactone decarboxylase family protein [Pseudactinotalea sp. HY158]QGH69932.1 carboxymuconolactone decarboxylase family protein [Pseudactinotalea sp. HY158]